MMWINKTVGLAGLISFAVITMMFIGCASQPAHTSMLSPSPESPTDAPLPNTALTPTQTIPPRNPLPELPLNLGTTWVYSSVVYAGSKPQDILTSTYIYTDAIISARSAQPYFAAEVSRTVSLISGEALFNAPEAEAWWYIISGTQVYRQPGSQLDFSKVSSSWLEYAFPLSANGWYPDPETRSLTAPDVMISGRRYTFPESEVAVPTGLFKNCSEIVTAYLGGALYAWFCPQFGVVEEKFDHAGTPYGYHTVLMRYSIPPSP